jgi:hypothetical protein
MVGGFYQFVRIAAIVVAAIGGILWDSYTGDGRVIRTKTSIAKRRRIEK